MTYTWAHFLDHPDEPEWLVRLPMVKASLRAMDTMTAFVAQHPRLRIPDLDYFAVTGASKRGWTIWDVVAMDTIGRVAVIAPVVQDAINFRGGGASSVALVRRLVLLPLRLLRAEHHCSL